MANDRHYFIHRSTYISSISIPLLDMNYISYGFSDFAQIPNFLDNFYNGGGFSYLEKTMNDEWGGLSRNRHQLYRFLKKMKAGSWIIVPLPYEFSVYEVLEDKAITIADIHETVFNLDKRQVNRNKDGFFVDDQGKLIDLGFARKVKPIELHISRSGYATEALRSRMKILQTNIEIKNLDDDIKEAVSRHKNQHPINFREELKDAVDNILKVIQDKLSDDKFESLIKWYFERIGATSVIPSKNPKGKEGKEDVDVIATFDLLQTIFYVQAKHHKGETDEWAVEQINLFKEKIKREECDEEYSRLFWVVSSCDSFSEKCVRLAQENNIQLIDGKRFASMLLDAGFLNIDTEL